MIDPAILLAIIERAKTHAEAYRDGVLSEDEIYHRMYDDAYDLLDVVSYGNDSIEPLTPDDIDTLLDVLIGPSTTH